MQLALLQFDNINILQEVFDNSIKIDNGINNKVAFENIRLKDIKI